MHKTLALFILTCQHRIIHWALTYKLMVVYVLNCSGATDEIRLLLCGTLPWCLHYIDQKFGMSKIFSEDTLNLSIVAVNTCIILNYFYFKYMLFF